MLHHYTSLDSLICMLNAYQENIVKNNYKKRKDFITLWASSIYTMNDPTEMKYGDDFLRKTIPTIEEKIIGAKGSILDVINKACVGDMNRNAVQKMITDHFFNPQKTPYVISMSHCEDDIVMWNQYGDNCNGVCLSFDDCVAEGLNFKIYAKNVDYEKKLTDKVLIDLLVKELQDFADKSSNLNNEELFSEAIVTYSTLLTIICPFVKNKDFSNEQEYRISFIDDSFQNVRFRTRNNMIVPYLPIDIPINKLNKITLGPCCRKEENKRSLQHLFQALGLNELEESIEFSKVHYRK